MGAFGGSSFPPNPLSLSRISYSIYDSTPPYSILTIGLFYILVNPHEYLRLACSRRHATLHNKSTMSDIIPYLPKDQQQAALNAPALAAPDGVTPNFDHPSNNNALAYGVIAACVVVSSLCMIIRFYARIFLFKKLKPEDYMILLAFGFFIFWTVFGLRLTEHPGYFVHQYEIRVKDTIPYAFDVHYAAIAYAITIPFIKIAILIEWTRVLVPAGTRNAFMWCCYGLMGLNIALLISIPIALSLICFPYEKIWDLTLPGTCNNQFLVGLASAAINLFIDVCMLVLPQRVIWNLQLSLKKKLGVSFFFSLGILACISAIFRVTTQVAIVSEADAIYQFGPVMFWAFAEITCGFIIACMPSTPKILKDHGVLDKMRRAARSFVGLKNTHLRSLNKPTASSVTTHTHTNTYKKIDEYGVPMKDLQPSESTEQLRDDKFDQGILRTTRVTVKQEYVSDAKGATMDHGALWHGDNRV
ncbi:hypothetical protein F5Y00DRAFT_245741 [Daldinia vernicosa]|uniref:uncharacterized protein n=1 Tax=Daldinia vernicosa TaxID=114800 RepID=UPI0020084A98|nr:uncharacterized protein F5Y00DRAFT_245741 [Daldinia vernicosa]KAI0845671.1 hypothetical protein F5Y00DRAFT_245741 [Daldinia vernicosa]